METIFFVRNMKKSPERSITYPITIFSHDLHVLKVKAIENLKVSFLREKRYAHSPPHSQFLLVKLKSKFFKN